ncbi:MAG: AAA family ATPase [Pseudomonadota bacterium]
MSTTFISYPSKEKARAETLRTVLTSNGLRPWMDDKKLNAGEKITKAIKAAILEKEIFVVILTKEVTKRSYVLREIDIALSEGKTIVPIVQSAAAAKLRKLDPRLDQVLDRRGVSFSDRLTKNVCQKVAQLIKGRSRTVFSTFLNFKGGVGKTTLTCLAGVKIVDNLYKKILIIDLDPQSNSTDNLLDRACIHERLVAGRSARKLFSDISRSQLKSLGVPVYRNLLGGKLDLIIADSDLQYYYRMSEVKREGALKCFSENLKGLAELYDLILFDTGPTLSLFTEAALKFSDRIFCPIIPEQVAIRGLSLIREAGIEVCGEDFLEKVKVVFNQVPKDANTATRALINDLRSAPGNLGENLKPFEKRVTEVEIFKSDRLVNLGRHRLRGTERDAVFSSMVGPLDDFDPLVDLIAAEFQWR